MAAAMEAAMAAGDRSGCCGGADDSEGFVGGVALLVVAQALTEVVAEAPSHWRLRLW